MKQSGSGIYVFKLAFDFEHTVDISNTRGVLTSSSIVTLIPSGLTSRILTCTELKGHCFVLVSGYVC